jgi:hypothetical protein
MFLQSHGPITAQQTTAEGSAYTTLLTDSFHSSAQVRTRWHGRTQARHSASRIRFLRTIGKCAEFHVRQALRF